MKKKRKTRMDPKEKNGNTLTLPAYPSLCRGLEYLQKVPYNILDVLNVVGLMIFETVFLGWLATLYYVCICVRKHISLPKIHRMCT